MGRNGRRLTVNGVRWIGKKNGISCFVFVVLTALFLSSCFEPQEGCFDFNATNYDVTADDPCSDCCNYPNLTVAFRHLIIPPNDPDTTLFFQYNAYYPSVVNSLDTFTIERIRYFLSDIRLVRPDGEEVRVQDSIDVEINSNNLRLEDNYAKVDRDIFQPINVGTIITQGQFSSIRFNVGLDDTERNIEPESVTTASQLYVQNDTLMYDTLNMNYLSSLVVFNRDTVSMMDSLVVEILPETALIEVPFEDTFDLDPGFSMRVTLNVDYLQWFKDIDVKNDPVNDAMRSKFIENIVTSFSISAIE